MTEQTPEPTELTYDAMMGADLHERGALSWVLDDALVDAVVTGTGWIRIRFRPVEGRQDGEPEFRLGDWTLDSPDPTQVVEVVTAVAGQEDLEHLEPGSLAYAQRQAELAGDLDQETEEETR